MTRIIPLLLLSFLLVTTPASAGWKDFLKNKVNTFRESGTNALTTSKLSDTKIGQGLKEALKVGINNTVDTVGRDGGYLTNEAIKITMPEKLRTLEKGLRAIGFGSKIDEFTLSMNSAAESAAPYARDIFLDSLFDMSIQDVQSLYEGGDTAATAYFDRTSRDDLYAAFKPIVDRKLREYGVTSQYKDLLSKYQAIPFSKNLPAPDVDDYVIDKALDGLFHVLGEQEKDIRTNPAAQVTTLLKDVFGKQ